MKKFFIGCVLILMMIISCSSDTPRPSIDNEASDLPDIIETPADAVTPDDSMLSILSDLKAFTDSVKLPENYSSVSYSESTYKNENGRTIYVQIESTKVDSDGTETKTFELRFGDGFDDSSLIYIKHGSVLVVGFTEAVDEDGHIDGVYLNGMDVTGKYSDIMQEGANVFTDISEPENEIYKVIENADNVSCTYENVTYSIDFERIEIQNNGETSSKETFMISPAYNGASSVEYVNGYVTVTGGEAEGTYIYQSQL